MLELRGITEIVGDCGTGKTILALSISQHASTIYIAPTLLRHSFVPSTVILRRIGSFLEFRTFVASELKTLTRMFRAKNIIIDGLENYLHVFEQPRKMSGDIFRIMTVLKALCFKEGIGVIVINNHYGNWVVDGICISNKYFGLPWDYLVNRRYLVTKSYGVRNVSLISSMESFNCSFTIDGMGAHLLDHRENP